MTSFKAILHRFRALAKGHRVLIVIVLALFGLGGIASAAPTEVRLTSVKEAVSPKIEYVDDESRLEGELETLDAGAAGEREKVVEQRTKLGAVIATKTVSENVTKQPLPKKIKRGLLTKSTVTETEVVPFTTQEQPDSALEAGQKLNVSAGANGAKVHTYEVLSLKGQPKTKNLVKTDEQVVMKPAVVKIGTLVKSNCDSNYSGCVPNVTYDLDCGDVAGPIYVRGYDKHGFDRDQDGVGCE